MTKLKALYVDDEDDIREIASISLQIGEEFSVECCSSGPEALLRVVEFRPDIILLDVMMPGMDGPETMRRLMETDHAGDIPVIFITARTQPDEIAQYRKMGAIGVIAKPFHPMELASEVKSLISQQGR